MSVTFVRNAHDDALYMVGEWTMFFLKWRIEDHEKGLVARCQVCYLDYGDIAEVFKQPSKRRCDNCFGTTFEGGIKARLVRPAIWQPNTEEHAEQRRGEIIRNSAMMQSTSDFKMRVGDWVLRADGTRWKMRNPSTNLLRDGFETATPEISNVGYIYGQLDLEDDSSVAYDVPISGVSPVPTPEELLGTNTHYLPDFSAHEFINGPLF